MNHILHKQIYAGLLAIVNDKSLYYDSPISKQYGHLTEEGKEAVVRWLELMAPEMHELERTILDARAKQLVIDELKR
jgi:hypothetical protein